MKRYHFETLRPICPVCRDRLEIGSVMQETNKDILEGILLCSGRQCQSEYPIISGIPILVADRRSYISQNILSVMSGTDMSADMESLVGDCCGPGSFFDVTRQYLSTYTFDHYGDLNPDETSDIPGSVVRLLEKGLAMTDNPIQGPTIDIGCSVGRTSFELAAKTKNPVLGIDLNFAMLRTASQILRQGIVRYPKRRIGMVYDRHEFAVSFDNSELVDFWACDAAALPFSDQCFGTVTSLNVLDCMLSPTDHLHSLARVLKAGGTAILSTPYDWSAAVTPMESWIGGHSQRSQKRGSPEDMLRLLLTKGAHPQSVEKMKIISELRAVPWS
ncbi:MAG: methyltransferase domain-containing protein, partial [Desulfobacteraceae bacterium]|nr:methyltransferase domain-containing protein [Desulfobacteraceae bacterium]